MAIALQRVSLYCGPGLVAEVSSSPDAVSTSQDEETSTSASSISEGVKRKHAEIEEDDEDEQNAKRGHFRPWSPPADEPLPLVINRSSSTESDQTTSKFQSPPSSSSNLSPSHSVHLPPPPPPPPPKVANRGQRNYKNMTRERRMEANARERSRVHTISAAFEKLRRAVPAYSHNQKLSKLSVLKVAASYILTLSRVLGNDYSSDQSAPSIEECVDNVSSTIQMEGKLRKRKEE